MLIQVGKAFIDAATVTAVMPYYDDEKKPSAIVKQGQSETIVTATAADAAETINKALEGQQCGKR